MKLSILIVLFSLNVFAQNNTPSIGYGGQPANLWMDEVGGINSLGNYQALGLDSSGNLKTAISGGISVSFPAVQNVNITGTGVTQPVSLSGGVAITSSSLPTGAATSLLQSSILSAIQGGLAVTSSSPITGTVSVPAGVAITNIPAVTVASGAISLSGGVAITSSVPLTVSVPAGIAITSTVTQNVNITGTGVTQPISGTISVSGGSIGISNFPATQNVNITGAGITQPISGTISVSGGSIGISNFPATQNVNITGAGITQPVSLSGGVAITSSVGLSVTNTPAVTISSGTITSITSSNLGTPSQITDVASAAITTTTTTSAFTPGFGVGYVIQIPVTVVSGTTPTYQVTVQESLDGGTNYENVYAFPTITATGFYYSPPLFLKGTRVRYVQTLGGTTPSFTRSINRIQQSAIVSSPVNNNATFAQGTVGTTAITLIAPQNAVGFILQAYDSNTADILYAINATATTTIGMQLQAGRDTGVVPLGLNVSLISASGTQSYSIQWIQQ